MNNNQSCFPPMPIIRATIRPYDKADRYQGTYEVTPTDNDLQLDTKGKLLMDDIVVNKIPFIETDNPEGGVTVYIGG